MVSDSTSVNAGVGPRLRRRVSPRICRTASSITQYSQTRRRSRSMDGPPQGSEALENIPHRPIPRGRLVEVIHSPSLNPWETRGSGCTDDYAPYDTLLPVGRHYIGKDETVAIERVNSRLRHWFARFRRRTCVVSKALEMVDATIALFAAYHVNRTATKLTLPLLS